MQWMVRNHWAQLGSNQRPRSYELPALTAELWALLFENTRIIAYPPALGKMETTRRTCTRAACPDIVGIRCVLLQKEGLQILHSRPP